MTTHSSKQANASTSASTPAAARTDDLLASGTEQQDGARGFEGTAQSETVHTGMEGIADVTPGAGQASPLETVHDKPRQTRADQG